MGTVYKDSQASGAAREKFLGLSWAQIMPAGALGLIVALAAILRFWNLSQLGYANHYYTAAVTSMLQSWRNFFFVAAEPGGSVTIDKPPVGLWLQAASAFVFGVNGFSVLLPQILAGIASVIVVYHLVQRSFGQAAGLLAALALAITPVAIATDRNNTIDSTLILTLLLAAWAFIKATEQGKLRFLLLGTFLVGVGFNIKMLEAYLPLPAFVALYFLGSKKHLGRKFANLGLAAVVLSVVSLSWAVAVDLTPTGERPYVGSSGDNSELNLIIGYNGLQRLVGMRGRRGPGGFPPGYRPRLYGNGAYRRNRTFENFEGFNGQFGSGNTNFFQPPGSNGQFPFPGGVPGFPTSPGGSGFMPPSGNNFGPGGFQPPPGANGFFGSRGLRPNGGFGGGFGGPFGTGRAGPLRLFIPPLSNEMSWLLPFGIFAIILLLVGDRLKWPILLKHQAVVLWGGWLVTGLIFFSIAGFFHPYYLSTIASPLAALVGIGGIELWRLRSRHAWYGLICLVAVTSATLALQIFTAQTFVSVVWWLPLIASLVLAGIILLVAANLKVQISPSGGFISIIMALLITPAIWSVLTTLNPQENQSLPSAYVGSGAGQNQIGQLQINPELLDYLQENTQDITYLMAVPSSMQGADYVIATGRPVFYLGGFMGQDNVVSADDLARMVADGKLRYIYWNNRGGFGGQSQISNWITTKCKPVTGFDTAMRNSGTPDGIPSGNNSGAFFGGGNMAVSLFDCAVNG